MILAKAYNFGNSMFTIEFQDTVVDAIIKTFVENGNILGMGKIVRPLVNLFPTGKGKKFLLDWLVLGELDLNRSSEEDALVSSTFCKELARRFMEVRLNEEGVPPYLTKPCSYHLHKDTNKCAK